MTLVIFCRLQCSRPSDISKIPAITRGWFYGYCLQVHWSHPLHLPMIHRNLVLWYYVGGSGKVTKMSVLSDTNLLTQIYLWDHCSYFRGAKQISDLFRLCRWTWPAFTKARKKITPCFDALKFLEIPIDLLPARFHCSWMTLIFRGNLVQLVLALLVNSIAICVSSNRV